jgi:N-acetyl-gamma-glutamyl-phosphate reductase
MFWELSMIRIVIAGASGFTGAELARLLHQHPDVSVVAATSETYSGKLLSDVYPALGQAGNLRLTALAETDLTTKTCDAVFLALPHGEAQALVPKLLPAGPKVIDLSGDFRFPDTAVYETWYKRKHTAKELANKAVYGLPEFFRKEIAQAVFVANSGCFATACELALYPLLRAGLANARQLVVDAKTSPSGAGRTPANDNMLTSVSENVVPYKTAGTHQHTPEIEMILSRVTGQDVRLTLTPQLVPARRGILAVAYAPLTQSLDSGQITALYQDTYAHEPFVQVRPVLAPWPTLTCAVGTNLCVISAAVDQRTGLAVVAASLDNLIKGASGQAVQNFNLMFGLDETSGLSQCGMVP